MLPFPLTDTEIQRLAMMGRMPEGEMLRTLFKRLLEEADKRNRGAIGVALHQSQGYAQVFAGLIERLEDKPVPKRAPVQKFTEDKLFGI